MALTCLTSSVQDLGRDATSELLCGCGLGRAHQKFKPWDFAKVFLVLYMYMYMSNSACSVQCCSFTEYYV